MASVEERVALGLGDSAAHDVRVTTLVQQLIDEVLWGSERKRETSDQTAASNVSPLMDAPMHLPWRGPRWAMEPLHL